MGTGRGKEKAQEQTMLKQSEADRAAIQPTQWETDQQKLVNDFVAQSKGSGGVESIDAMKPYLNLYNSAINDQQNDRMSNGILTLAHNGGNANQAAGLNTWLKYKRQQDAAGSLENAYNATNAAVTGEGFQLANLANDRNMGRAGLSQQAYSTYLNRPKEPSFLDRVLQFGQLAVQGGSALGTMGGSAGIKGI